MSVSFWWEQAEKLARPHLASDISVDVRIVEAGFTGLWTAYYLALTVPTLSAYPRRLDSWRSN